MIDAILTTLNLIIGPIDKLSRLYKDTRVSKRDQLSHALYLLFEACGKIVDVSERIVDDLQKINDKKVLKRISDDHEEITQIIMSIWQPLISLVNFMEIADSEVAKTIRRSFGPKLLLVRMLSQAIRNLGVDKQHKKFRILKKLDPPAPEELGSGVGVVSWFDYPLLGDSISEETFEMLEQSGEINIQTFDLQNPEHIANVVRQGRENITQLRKLREQLRAFMNEHFKKEDFFFTKSGR